MATTRHDSPYDREGCGESDPRLLPHPGALVVPAVAKIHYGIGGSGKAPDRVGYPYGEEVANHRSKHDPVSVLFEFCVGRSMGDN